MPDVRARAAAKTLAVATVVTYDEWTRLAQPWNALAARSRPGSAFLSFDWFAAAWAWRQADSQLLILVVQEGERLVAALPLVRVGTGARARRRLAGLTVPDTQYFDVICAPEDAAVAADQLARALARRRDWDELQLAYLPEGGTVTRWLLPALLQAGARSLAGATARNAFVPVAGTWEQFYGSRSRSLKKANNLAANRLAKAGEVVIEHYAPGAGDVTARERLLAAAIDVSARSWKRTTGNSLDEPGPGAFIRALTAAADRRGEVSVWLAYLDGRPVAMEYQLVADGNVHALRADFDAACVDISPGSHLFRQLLERQFGQGRHRYYMGPGDNPYKARWTDQDEPLAQATVLNRTLRGGLRWHWLHDLKPTLRAWRDRVAGLRPRRPEPPGGQSPGTGK